MKKIHKDMQSFYVELGAQRYPIYIGTDLLDQTDLLTTHLAAQQILIVTNTTVAPLYLAKIKKACQEKQCDAVILPDGEQYKTLESLNQIFTALLTNKHTRLTTLLALGGGVIGDLTGFAAASYMRGVSYVQLPTTLLAQVDAAIGGKTAVNHVLGKNMIGAFYQPRAVISDIGTLATLPEREFRAGLAEVIKYGLILDSAFFTWLETHLTAILEKDLTTLQQMILRCCQIKATVVTADEREQGSRALLNLGHTFAHAIENGLGYGRWLHGEAVAIGLLLAAELSAQMGWFAREDVIRIKKLLTRTSLPVALPAELTAAQLLEIMSTDKKNIHGRLRFVILKGIGQAVVTEEIPLSKLQNTLQCFM